LVIFWWQVFFLTNGGCEIYEDLRRNSLEEALKLSLENGLKGIVSEIKGIFRNPGAVSKIKESNLSLLTYGKLKYVWSFPLSCYMLLVFFGPIVFSIIVLNVMFLILIFAVLVMMTVMFQKRFTCST
jgi:hypothetical protein